MTTFADLRLYYRSRDVASSPTNVPAVYALDPHFVFQRIEPFISMRL